MYRENLELVESIMSIFDSAYMITLVKIVYCSVTIHKRR